MSDLSDTVKEQLEVIKRERSEKLKKYSNLNRRNNFQIRLMYDNRGVKLVKIGIYIGERMAAYEFVEFGLAAQFAKEYRFYRSYKKMFKKTTGFPCPSYLR
ncbi:MAG: hypothetical protein Q7S06_03915 [Nanoarchaeota archaeon]|nr:hypothetical protein [Nanoarchaeota archaeon]